jgi:spermidine synthase
VHDVEIDRRMFEMIRPHLPAETRRSLEAPGVRITFTDPRRFVAGRGRYDAILVAAPEPISGEANRFYTREFFADCAANLDAGGVLGFRLQSAENFWTPLLARRMASIHAALKAVFPHIVVLPGTANVFIASGRPLPADAAVLAHRLDARHVQAGLMSAPYLRYLYADDRRAGIARTLETTRVRQNTDVQPICYQYAALGWLSRFFPGAAAMEVAAPAPGTGWPARWWALMTIVVLILFGLGRVVPAARRALLVGLAGLTGMVLETILILHFQMKNGILFQDIGVLLTGFMGGLAAGALALDRLSASRRRGGAIPRWWGAALLAGLAALGLLVDGLTGRGLGGGLPAVTGLLAAAGALVSGLFAWVSLQGRSNQEGLVSPLYAADLLGGCAGSLLASLILIPLAGLAVSARWIAVLAALSLVLL